MLLWFMVLSPGPMLLTILFVIVVKIYGQMLLWPISFMLMVYVIPEPVGTRVSPALML